jgi:hypothetical protein
MSWIPDAIGAALIAGGASFLGLLITNQSKVSGFRQEWIDALRDHVATLISDAFTIQDAQASNREVTNLDACFTEMHKANALISLRLNMKEKESIAIIETMAALRAVIYDKDAEFPDVAARVSDLTHATNVVLKNEWRRVKKGEALYRWTFRAVVIAIIALLIALAAQNVRWVERILANLQ